jgi:hypothetical protein
MIENATPKGDILVALDIYMYKVSIVLWREDFG